ncbi:hypothetical protein GlitD10_1579 [Gloeomargarita lithophora Alchichica-D10]|uniref:Activator of Hsp90 ATPase 1 family protein n=1 Tax=Gloeomargarita lithophora Alchichica-D10 TaxID=1188229 RepID=A0A1J0ADB7_9CYAN|nr:hypothetical protein [Gloeomargarita lithophora]APB33903.1 hypothetical protein GlitD10_1579 [Gloeomargarita lithophora Alchichica-D10]
MFGQFQHSVLRIELRATANQIRQVLVEPEALQRWWFAGWPTEDYAPLTPGKTVELWWGVLPILAQVRDLGSDCLRWRFSQGVDGFQTWYWGEGWVQVQLEAVSFLPLGMGQMWQLWQLRDYLQTQTQTQTRP